MVEAQRILHSAWVYRLELKKSIGQHGGSAMCRKPREKTRERTREKTQRENPEGKPERKPERKPREKTRGKTRGKTQRENPERKPREKTQRENQEKKWIHNRLPAFFEMHLLDCTLPKRENRKPDAKHQAQIFQKNAKKRERCKKCSKCRATFSKLLRHLSPLGREI